MNTDVPEKKVKQERMILPNVRTGGVIIGAGVALLLLSACETTGGGSTSAGANSVGPGAKGPLGGAERDYSYSPAVRLDVAVPVFDPGIPRDEYGNIDDDEVVKQAIWPQVRRLEANRFATNTRRALENTKAFGAVRVTPTPSASADVYVLGEIIYSDTETVKIQVTVQDARQNKWGEKTFEHLVGEGFYRDALRKNKNPYGPVFTRIGDYVYERLKRLSAEEMRSIQEISDVRYAAMYSPEVFEPYLSRSGWGADGPYELEAAPAESLPMYQRVKRIQAKDQQFIDSLQDSYETLHAETNDDYRTYQREALPVALEAKKARRKRNLTALGTALGAVATGVLAKNAESAIGQTAALAAGLGTLVGLREAFEANEEVQAQLEILAESTQNLDIQVTPQVVEFEDQRIELEGTATEQHAQLRQRLAQIHRMESTPDTTL